MASLSAFIPQDQDFLAGVFYTLGVWMSQVDDDGQDSADAEEERVLMVVLERVSKKFADTPLISEMAAESARQEKNHMRWAETSDDAFAHIEKAVKMLKQNASNEELLAFKKGCLHVAKSVAVAFQEDGDAHNEFADKQKLSEKISTFIAKLTNKSVREGMNISPAEDTALHELNTLLKKL